MHNLLWYGKYQTSNHWHKHAANLKISVARCGTCFSCTKINSQFIYHSVVPIILNTLNLNLWLEWHSLNAIVSPNSVLKQLAQNLKDTKLLRQAKTKPSMNTAQPRTRKHMYKSFQTLSFSPLLISLSLCVFVVQF